MLKAFKKVDGSQNNLFANFVQYLNVEVMTTASLLGNAY